MISISMEGVNDALETIKDIVIPWRRQNAERKAKIENALRQAEIQRLNGESLLTQAKVERERAAAKIDNSQSELILSQAKKMEAEAQLIMAQAEKTLAEAEAERTRLRQSQIELALKIVDRYAPNIDSVRKIDYVVKLIPILNQLISSELEHR